MFPLPYKSQSPARPGEGRLADQAGIKIEDTMEANKQAHNAAELPIEERVDYLLIVAAMVAADGKVVDAEIAKLLELCKALGLPSDRTADVLAAANAPDDDAVHRALQRLKSSKLKFTLMTDCLFMAYADGKLVPEEDVEIRCIAAGLEISEKQVAALRRYVEVVNKVVQDKMPADRAKEALADAVASVASVGAPIGAIAVSGSVYGLSAAGITSGLAALGMGAGMLTGLGAAIGIGIGTYAGVKWIYKKVAT